MELQKCSHEPCNDSVHYESKNAEDILRQQRIAVLQELVIESPLDCFYESISHKDRRRVSSEQDVNQKQQEILPVPEADAVVDPWTMMVHVQNASVAS